MNQLISLSHTGQDAGAHIDNSTYHRHWQIQNPTHKKILKLEIISTKHTEHPQSMNKNRDADQLSNIYWNILIQSNKL